MTPDDQASEIERIRKQRNELRRRAQEAEAGRFRDQRNFEARLERERERYRALERRMRIAAEFINGEIGEADARREMS